MDYALRNLPPRSAREFIRDFPAFIRHRLCPLPRHEKNSRREERQVLVAVLVIALCTVALWAIGAW